MVGVTPARRQDDLLARTGLFGTAVVCLPLGLFLLMLSASYALSKLGLLAVGLLLMGGFALGAGVLRTLRR
jgi:hypothetical protein